MLDFKTKAYLIAACALGYSIGSSVMMLADHYGSTAPQRKAKREAKKSKKIAKQTKKLRRFRNNDPVDFVAYRNKRRIIN